MEWVSAAQYGQRRLEKVETLYPRARAELTLGLNHVAALNVIQSLQVAPPAHDRERANDRNVDDCGAFIDHADSVVLTIPKEERRGRRRAADGKDDMEWNGKDVRETAEKQRHHDAHERHIPSSRQERRKGPRAWVSSLAHRLKGNSKKYKRGTPHQGDDAGAGKAKDPWQEVYGGSNAKVLRKKCQNWYNPYALAPQLLNADSVQSQGLTQGTSLSGMAAKGKGAEGKGYGFTAEHLKTAERSVDFQPPSGIDSSMSLSKFRTLKSILFTLMEQNSDLLEEATVACAWVYFERLALQGLVNKSNRKLIFSACLLLAIKYNQDKQFDERIPEFFRTTLPQAFRYEVTAKDVFRTEFKVLAALEFDLGVSLAEASPHFQHLCSPSDTRVTIRLDDGGGAADATPHAFTSALNPLTYTNAHGTAWRQTSDDLRQRPTDCPTLTPTEGPSDVSSPPLFISTS